MAAPSLSMRKDNTKERSCVTARGAKEERRARIFFFLSNYLKTISPPVDIYDSDFGI